MITHSHLLRRATHNRFILCVKVGYYNIYLPLVLTLTRKRIGISFVAGERGFIYLCLDHRYSSALKISIRLLYTLKTTSITMQNIHKIRPVELGDKGDICKIFEGNSEYFLQEEIERVCSIPKNCWAVLTDTPVYNGFRYYVSGLIWFIEENEKEVYVLTITRKGFERKGAATYMLKWFFNYHFNVLKKDKRIMALVRRDNCKADAFFRKFKFTDISNEISIDFDNSFFYLSMTSEYFHSIQNAN